MGGQQRGAGQSGEGRGGGEEAKSRHGSNLPEESEAGHRKATAGRAPYFYGSPAEEASLDGEPGQASRTGNAELPDQACET